MKVKAVTICARWFVISLLSWIYSPTEFWLVFSFLLLNIYSVFWENKMSTKKTAKRLWCSISFTVNLSLKRKILFVCCLASSAISLRKEIVIHVYLFYDVMLYSNDAQFLVFDLYPESLCKCDCSAQSWVQNAFCCL